MADVHSREQRSRNMAAIKGKDTRPEMIVRRLCHAMGMRFRLHRRDLPGRPDLVFPKRRCVVFVHGCFWHMHACRFGAVVPKTNAAFWQAKREANVRRDSAALQQLADAGWKSLIVWECETKDLEGLRRALVSFFGNE